ncbi:MAG TPA: PVC-type heme-binding CxxCH protein [Planctomycetota bacterium]|nr:PVC-type heme-binding CxxCH protein [Planctomycetota bacterium]
MSVTTLAGETPLFDGRTFEGWEGDTKETWRIENGELIGGSLTRRQKNNNFLATTREYENFELRLKIKLLGTEGFVNSGIQIRSKRVPNHHEVSGYQADFGHGYDGGLYDESRRNKVLAMPPKELQQKIVKKEDWNDYRIRAEGPRIQLWLNGVQTVDYTENAPNIPQKGIIALQIHGGATAEVHFKDMLIEELPASKPVVKPPLERLTDSLEPAPPIPPFANGAFALRPGEVVVFTGPENVVIEQRSGWLETALASAAKAQAPRFRHMGWEGDTVWRQNRMENHGTWKENFDAVGATLIFTWFGQNEALDQTRTAADFASGYGALLDSFKERTPRIVVLSPAPFEKPASPLVPDNTPRNSIVQQYAEAARKLAQERGFVFVDVFTPLSQRPADAPRLTRNGIHFTDEGIREVSALIAKALGAEPATAGAETLRQEIIEKNRIWFDCWRCMNWAFAYGDRTTQPFAKGTQQHPPFVKELTRFKPLVNRADERVHAIAAGKEPPPTLPLDPAPPAPAAQTPDEQMKNFTLYPGMSVGLFADEKLDMIKPIQIRWDELGRLWVLCIPSYPQLQPGQRANDYLLVLEDTNGDGKADKSWKYCEGLVMPMGFEFGDGGIYICESTQLTHWRDSNGDGKGDTRRVVLSGFGTGDTHQMINSIRWQPDGCLWFTQGYHVWSYIETPHGISELNRSGVWRFNPRTLKLDGYFNDSTAGLNSWGVAFDDYGQVFHGGGANYCLYFSTPGLINTLHPLAYKQDFCVSRGKSMEPEFLSSKHLPDDLQNVLLKSTYFTSQISMYKISDDGAGFKSTALPDLMASKSTDFRPVETRVGPDGAIYVCDWLNPIIGHYQASYRDPRRDRSHGRIWRLTANGRPLVKRPELEKMDAPALLEQLRSPERWVREQARRLLYSMKKETAVAAADAWIAKLDPNDPEAGRLRYEATGVFCAHEAPRPALVDGFLASKDFRLRCWGTRLLSYWTPALPDALSLLERSVTDEHPRVRMEALVAASYFNSADALKVATLALDKPTDFYINYALTQCTHALAPAWQKALAEGKLDFGTRTHALTYALRTVGGKQAVGQIKALLKSGRVNGEMRFPLLAVMIEAGTSDDLRFALNETPTSPIVMNAFYTAARLQKKVPSGDLAVDLARLLTQADASLRSAAWRLAGAWQIRAQAPAALAAAQDEKLPALERAAAIEAHAALQGKDALPALQGLTSTSSAEVRAAAIAALAPLDLPATAARAIELLAEIKDADAAAALLLPVLAQGNGPEALSKAMSDKKLPAASAALVLQWMAKTGRGDEPFLSALNSAAGVAIDRKEYSPELVAKLVAAAKSSGDAARGEKLFRMQEYSCLNCHKVGNEGTTIGPELTSLARAMTAESITESVLWPKRQVKEGYLLTLVTLKDGRRYQGMKSAETAETLTLRDAAGPVHVLSKAEIKKRNDAGTLMPDGLTDRMTPGELSDLLKYLMELGK